MSESTPAGAERLRRESPTVDAVCRQLERQLPEPEVAHAVRFAEIFFSKAPAELFQERSTDSLARMAIGAYRFLERSRPDRVDVEVFNPDVDNEGWYAPVTVIRTNLSERPFIVDTIREFVHAQGLAIDHYIYPVLHVDRDHGRIVDIRHSREGHRRESVVHCEIPRVSEAAARERISVEIAQRLQDVVRATDDFRPMLAALDRVSVELEDRAKDLPNRRGELEEIRAFLRWLREGAFVFLGYRAYDWGQDAGPGAVSILVEPGSGLGILRNEAESRYAKPVLLEDLDDDFRKRVEAGPSLIISKTNAESTVHRRARMDYIGVKKLDRDGRAVGEHRFIGLFTSKAYADEAEGIPILREKLHTILEEAGVQEGSHDFKEINTIFNSMPKEELFVTSAREIGANVRTVLTSYNTAGVRVTLRGDPLKRGVSAMVILPRDRFSGEVRRRIEGALVDALDAQVLNYHLTLGSGDQARLHFYLVGPADRIASARPSDLEQTVRELIRSWGDRLKEALERLYPADMARRQAERYGEAFSAEYQAATDPTEAVQDVLELEAMTARGQSIAIAFGNPLESAAAPGVGALTELKLYLRGERLVLSDFMPSLENSGLRVIALSPFEVEGADVESAVVYVFAVQDVMHRPLNVASIGALLSETILAVRAGDVIDDSMNALVQATRLHWREVDVLRAYGAYAFQCRAVPSSSAIPMALVKHPHLARLLFDLFEARFDPDRFSSDDERRGAARDVTSKINEALRGVSALADDRAIRNLLLLVEATVRTNYFRSGGRSVTRRSGGVPYTSFKFASRGLQAIARTRLRFEVWVHSSRMEGVHLRGAKVARGGIRWSDRPDDFRTEVLGLVRTQMVKNAVIVPAGSKGGFVTRRHLADPEQMAEEGREQYCTLVRGLLDLTDNLDVAARPVPPERVVCYDEPDPYLVVAADKGTAKFSDLANAVAGEYDFWLGDAFASGGSHGYDHKKVGITARGAWECVKRHFLEKSKDIQTEPFTVVGIGDMGGDVFGNGMLLSRQIQLVAAFDHRHVFIDPTPNPEVSYLERERLFKLPRSSWGDYDTALLSPGGVIVSRLEKEVELSEPARLALGLPEDQSVLDGESLIRAVLKAPADLLWNGGIGTYVKASSETDSEAGDASNDAVRVDASELRCQVVGEGGNLGFTQLGRIEFALRGGTLNTDAIDNCGGVDLSDREVNLKVLLNPLVRSGELAVEDRNALLERLTDPVAELVVRDSRSQALAVSLDQIRAATRVGSEDFRDLMTALEKAGVLDRTVEHLPTLEVLVERQERGGTLTRPELCLLLAHSKLNLMGEMIRSHLPDEPGAETYLTSYFPAAALEAAGRTALAAHPLRREIVASQLTNDLVDLMGAGWLHHLVRTTGRTPGEVVHAWLVASRLAGHRELLGHLSSDGVGSQLPIADAHRWLLGLARVLRRSSRWILLNVPRETLAERFIQENLEGLSVLRGHFDQVVQGEERVVFEKHVGELKALGASDAFAKRLITLRFLDELLEVVRVSRETQSDPLEVARVFYRVSDHLRLPWLRAAVFDSAENDRWGQRAVQSLADDLARAHTQLVRAMIRDRNETLGLDLATERLLRSHQSEISRFRDLLEEIQQEARPSLSGLSVAVREIALLADRLNQGQ